jgi:hypothetical protein
MESPGIVLHFPNVLVCSGVLLVELEAADCEFTVRILEMLHVGVEPFRVETVVVVEEGDQFRGGVLDSRVARPGNPFVIGVLDDPDHSSQLLSVMGDEFRGVEGGVPVQFVAYQQDFIDMPDPGQSLQVFNEPGVLLMVRDDQ